MLPLVSTVGLSGRRRGGLEDDVCVSFLKYFITSKGPEDYYLICDQDLPSIYVETVDNTYLVPKHKGS